MRSALFALGLLAFSAPLAAQDARVLDAVVHDACGKRVAFLGESPVHGFGRALQLKVVLVRRLVAECGYDAVFFESGSYDFLNIQRTLRAGGDVADSTIAAAIGGLWANRETAPLVAFLGEKARRGAVRLGGLDDQLGRGTWAQRALASELAGHLRAADSSSCLAVFRRHVQWEYTDAAPYSRSDQTRLLGCLDRVESAVRSAPAGAEHEDALAMAENLRRLISRDFPEDTTDAFTRSGNARDRSMYENFHWLLARLPRRSKVIVWCATPHAAKALGGVPRFEPRVPLGSYVRRQLGSRSFALAFSEYAGAYAFGRRPPTSLPPAPPGSLEARAFEGNNLEVRYLDARRLAALGPLPARALGTDFTTAAWDGVFDGLVIIRDEHPPHPNGA